ncbi:MAG: BamA/TamA family outer membrane protein [Phaeodactylibacter sp.]|nr:BamA/TamA family outer membrane protein [Phaeodactylibacter sp.]MCB9050380.1 BamA/TamA family outer membrane protein [Lewinellaceae bacterium]
MAVFLLSACNTSKYLSADQYLLKGNSIKLKSKGNINRKRELKYELSTLYKQNENGKFFFIPREWFYFVTQDPNDTTKFDRWQQRVIAEPPAIYDPKLTEATEESMKFYLQYKGFFNANVFAVPDVRKKKIYITYHVEPRRQFTIDTTLFFSEDSLINIILQEIAGRTLLSPGAGIDGSLYDRERDRIVQYLRNHGYANFYANSVAPLEADTTVADKKARLYLEVLPPLEDSVHQAYTIDDITVYMDYIPGQEDTLLYDTEINGVLFRSPRPYFRIKPEAILENLFIRQNTLYNQRDFDLTNQQLTALGAFRFVRLKPEPDPEDPSLLDIRIELTQHKKMELGLDFELNYASRSASGAGNLIGLTASPSLRNRNLLKGAELLITDFSAGVEFNPAPSAIAEKRFWNTVDIRLQTDLYLPRFVDYLGIWGRLNRPKVGKHELFVNDNFYKSMQESAATRLSASYNYLLILDFYRYNLLTGTFGFDFPRKRNQRLIINHLGLDYLQPTTELRFDSILDVNPFLERSFGEQLFVSFLFRDLNFVHNARPNRRGNSHYIGFNLELAGAEVWAGNVIYNAFALEPDTLRLRFKEGVRVDFSQYVRTQVDLRKYWSYSTKRSLAGRVAAGIARPFGYTTDVPYVKQFYAGGPNSIRAWAPRGLGPGSFEDTLSFDRTFNTRLYQSGDIRLEANLEYRFNIFWVVNGAFFLDAGNIWTFRRDTARCGSQFLLRGRQYSCTDNMGENVVYTNEPFYKQIAIGGGFGLRLDFSYFILRLDMAAKLRHPTPLPSDNGRGNWQDYWFRDFRESGGRSGLKFTDIVSFNLGFGYPF